jgi:hypothetical protein
MVALDLAELKMAKGTIDSKVRKLGCKLACAVHQRLKRRF